MPGLLPILRGLHVLCLVSLLGTLALRGVVAPGFDAAQGRLERLAKGSLVGAVATLALWFLAQTAAFAGADAGNWGEVSVAVPAVLVQTRFGHVLALRLVLLLAAWPLLRRGRAAWVAAAVAAGLALASQGVIGHAGAAGGGIGADLLASESFHLIAAGLWLGGLLPLLILMAALPAAEAGAAARRFTRIGLPCVLVIMATAFVQGEVLVGGLAGLVGSDYGRVALLKIVLFALLLALAAVNRFALSGGPGHVAAHPALRYAVAAEAVLGALVLFAAATLASDEPGAHVEPVWPFPWRPSTAALEDPDIRREVLIAAAACAAGALALLAGAAWRRGRWLLAAAGVAAIGFAAPHLSPLLVEAYPTSYFVSPTGFSAASIARGAAVYAANCTGCHGAQGAGDGPQAKALPVPPADLTAPHLWEHSDGELFWWLTHGMDNPEGGLSMPGFGEALPEDDRWALIDFIRANNAGLARRATGDWPRPMQAPSFDILCPDGKTADIADLRGRVLRLAALGDGAASPSPPLSPTGGARAVTLSPAPTGQPPAPGACAAAEPQAWDALAILLGVPRAALAGTQILVDRNGWLRAAWRPGEPGGWPDPAALAAAVARIEANPVAAPTAAGHVHHH